MDFGEELKKRRKALGLRQEDLAKILQLDQSTISLWELGKCLPSLELQRLVLHAFDAVKARR